MHTGKGNLILRDGRKLALNFQFGSNFDEVRSGYLHFNTAELNPASYGDRLEMICNDGTQVSFVVTHFSDRYLAVTGRVNSLAA
ncbi:hypothetical protein [Bosea sp. Root670]|uniref:hypothetical protein n=1 Tax=Bosea sp. Root670 TaxID=1736583 RepID=UPI000780BA1B|nr:hypothetical protein [Bosea sp. Root670]